MMITVKSPSTSAAVLAPSSRWRALDRSQQRSIYILPRDGLGYSSITATTCPWCSAREPDRLEVLTLYRPRVARWVGAGLSPPVVFAGAATLLLLGAPAVASLVFGLGPAVAIAVIGGDWSWGAQTARTRVSSCSACGAQLAALARHEAWWRRLKHTAALGLLGCLGGLVAGILPSLVPPLMASLAAFEVVAWVGEKRARALKERVLPALLTVGPQHATLDIPADWSPLLHDDGKS